jgi:hypothetical protein
MMHINWISVEQIPVGNMGDCLVTTASGNVRQTFHYGNDEFYDHVNGYLDVVAYAEMPEPYSKDSNNTVFL